MVAWLVLGATEVAIKFEVTADGRTRYKNITGHRAHHKTLGFGEHMHFMVVKDDSRRSKYDGELLSGYFTSEYMVINREEMYTCPTLRAALQEMRADYNHYTKEGARITPQTDFITCRGGDLRVPEAVDRGYIPRRSTIGPDGFELHGLTAGCPECARIQTWVGNRRPRTFDM